MEINIHNSTANQFTRYSNVSVMIKEKEYNDNIIVTNDNILPLQVNNIRDMKFEDLLTIIEQKPDLIIFGSGSKIVFPDLKILQKLNNLSIGTEIMTIQALCRTFNFLVSENRKIACFLFFKD